MDGTLQTALSYMLKMFNSKYRRIKHTSNSKYMGHEIIFMLCVFTVLAVVLILVIKKIFNSCFNIDLDKFLNPLIFYLLILIFFEIISFVFLYKRRELVTQLDIPKMSEESKKISRKISQLFNDKQIIDVLKLSNVTRYGYEMPEIYVYLDDDQDSGYIAIENIGGNYLTLDKEKYNQIVSGIIGGKYKKYSVVSSELILSDTYVLFHFEDVLTSKRFILNNPDDLKECLSENPNIIKFSKDLSLDFSDTAHLSIVARTRAGKTFLAGRYLAEIMVLQGWEVEYNSAKRDLYVDKFNGQHDPVKIVERAEYYCEVMLERLETIHLAGKEKYKDIGLSDIGLFFDEIGNLNAALDSEKEYKKRWEQAINKLSATGGSAGIHIIAISQHATKEGFLPSLARVNCSDAVIMLGGAADSADERRYLMSGYADMPRRNYKKGTGLARFISAKPKWHTPHYYETPLINF